MAKKIHIIEDNIKKLVALNNAESDDIIIFNEAFHKGEVSQKIDCDTFWKKRYAYFEGKGISKLEYFDNVIKPLTILQDVSSYKDVILYFSSQKNSQINTIALLTYLLAYYKKDIAYYLITINTKDDKIQRHKTKLSRNKLLEAEKQWQLFCKNNSNKK